LDWLLAIADVVGEHEQDKVRGPDQTSATLPDGMREVRINYREMEAQG